MQKQNGIVLISVLLLLIALSLVAISLCDSSALITKINSAVYNKTQAFYVAESHLVSAEQKIVNGESVPTAEEIDTTICGATFYRITASATHYSAVSMLQSTFVKLDAAAHCVPKPSIKQGRQSLLLVY